MTTMTTIQPYNHTAIQPYSHTAIQPYNHDDLDNNDNNDNNDSNGSNGSNGNAPDMSDISTSLPAKSSSRSLALAVLMAAQHQFFSWDTRQLGAGK